jgi:hypothetical protein
LGVKLVALMDTLSEKFLVDKMAAYSAEMMVDLSDHFEVLSKVEWLASQLDMQSDELMAVQKVEKKVAWKGFRSVVLRVGM